MAIQELTFILTLTLTLRIAWPHQNTNDIKGKEDRLN